jgi:triacylglycerol lipase
MSNVFLASRASKIIPMSVQNDHGYMAIEKDRLVICFAGSDDWLDWISNFEFLTLDEGMTIHAGFYDSWLNFKDFVTGGVKNYIIPYVEKRIVPKLVVRGHSRGAALATLCARHIAKNIGLPCSGIVYGSPKLGNVAYQQEFNTLPIDLIRVRNGFDFVCDLPPWDMGYRDVGSLVAIPQPAFHQYPPFSIIDHVHYDKDLAKAGL